MGKYALENSIQFLPNKSHSLHPCIPYVLCTLTTYSASLSQWLATMSLFYMGSCWCPIRCLSILADDNVHYIAVPCVSMYNLYPSSNYFAFDPFHIVSCTHAMFCVQYIIMSVIFLFFPVILSTFSVIHSSVCWLANSTVILHFPKNIDIWFQFNHNSECDIWCFNYLILFLSSVMSFPITN